MVPFYNPSKYLTRTKSVAHANASALLCYSIIHTNAHTVELKDGDFHVIDSGFSCDLIISVQYFYNNH